MWYLCMFVGVGGAAGAMARFVLADWISSTMGKGFPYATIFINIFGSLLMGIMIGILFSMMPKGKELHALIVVGALGGFTTFSAFSYDAYMLLERGDLSGASIYIIGSVFLSILAFLLGMWVFKVIA